MKVAVLALFLVGIASCYGQGGLFKAMAFPGVYKPVCKPTEVVFLLDHSENARKASTLDNGNNFQLLIDAWQKYMRDLQRLGDNLFRIWAWAYSSKATPIELVRRSSPPSQSINAPIGTLSSGGSWTYMGLDQIKNQRPSLPNNVVIIISAQGSMNNFRRNQAQDAYNTLAANGWNTYVIGAKSSPIIDMQELRAVNGNKNPVILDDNQPTNKKSYRLLYDALRTITDSILCPRELITQPPTLPPITFPPITRPPVTRPPNTGICSNCRVEGGYGFDNHGKYCDLFYQCLPHGDYVLKQCPYSLIWDDGIGSCVRPSNYQCHIGPCSPQLTGTRYGSGVCCNMYFECNGKHLAYLRCPSGHTFNEATGQCARSDNPVKECAARGAHYCDENLWNQGVDCSAYQPDPLGSPCRYLHMGVLLNTSLGTMWDQKACTLVKSDACLHMDFSTRGLETISDSCTAHIISTFESGRPDVESPRDPTLKFYVRFVGVIKTRGAIVFRPNLVNAHAYYYFFNNNAIRPNSAFRIVFKLDDQARSNVEYDIFSNNYCPLCPETIGATIRRTSPSSYVITTNFIDNTNGQAVQTRTQVDGAQAGGWLSLIVIWGNSDVHGVVKVLSNNKQLINTVPIQSVQHTVGSAMKPNKCGILLGGGPHNIFVGMIDEFAYYSTCANIEEVLNM